MKCADQIISYLDHIKRFFIQFTFHADFFALTNVIFLKSSDVLFVDDSLIRYNSQNYAFKLFNDLID